MLNDEFIKILLALLHLDFMIMIMLLCKLREVNVVNTMLVVIKILSFVLLIEFFEFIFQNTFDRMLNLLPVLIFSLLDIPQNLFSNPIFVDLVEFLIDP